MTTAEIDQRKAAIQEHTDEMDREPEFVKMRAWVKEVFGSNYESVCGFAARLMISEGRLVAENAELARVLNHTHALSRGLSQGSKIADYIKKNIAGRFLEIDPEEPAALAFMSGIEVSKTMQAGLGGSGRASKFDPIKAFAFQLFDARSWKSTKQARNEIWPEV